MLAEDAEAGAEDEKEVEELKKQGINPLPKPPPGVGLLPTPPRHGSTDSAPADFGNAPANGSSSTAPDPGDSPTCSEDDSASHGPPAATVCPQASSGANSAKKIPSLFEIVVKPTGQLAQKLGVRSVRFYFYY